MKIHARWNSCVKAIEVASMSGKRICIVFALSACAVLGQTSNETFYFPNAENRALMEYVNVIRSVAAIENVTQDAAKKTITVQGTTDQLSLAAWLAKEFNAPPASRSAMVRRDYPGSVAPNDEVHIYYPAYTTSPVDLQEALNLTRSIADIQRFFPCMMQAAIVSRGTREQTDLAEWLLTELDQPAESMKPGHREHPFPADPRASLAQVYVLTNTGSPQAIQQVVNGTRSMVDIQRCFPYNARKVLAMRGTSDQIAFADWLLGLLDRPASAAVDMDAHEYRYNDGPRMSIARVFFLSHVDNPQQLQDVVNEVRTAAGLQRTYPIIQAKAIAMRGTGDQISRAEQMLKDR
jgi:hypothetical protein